jgi:enoyl-CoA hydratase/carnithine racemase
VDRVVPADALAKEARELARAMAEQPPEVLAAAKAALRHGAESDLESAMRHEESASAALRRARER